MKYITSLACLLLFTAGVTAQDQSVIYKLEKGKSYKYLQEIKVAVSQEFQGQAMNIDIDGTVTNTISVLDLLPNGNFQLKNTIDNALITIESPQGAQTMGNDLAGTSVSMEMTNTGKVVSRDSLPKGGNPQNAQIVARAIETFPRLDGLNGKPLVIGATWSDSQKDTIGAGGKMLRESQTTYTVKEMAKVKDYDCFKILVEGTTDMSGSMSRGGMDMTISGSGTVKGILYIAAKEGLFVEANMEQSDDQTIMIPSQGNMRIPMTQTTTSKIELTK